MRQIALDQFFTPEEDAIRFIRLLNERYDLSQFDMVLEPSAGAGAFYKHLPQNRLGLDICPQFEGIQEADFLKWHHTGGRTAVIGNPPFGRRGSLAKKFFQKCSQFAHVIAFIFPAIFSKEGFYKSLDKQFHLVYEEPLNLFHLPDGGERLVNCVFQIWEKREICRTDRSPEADHPHFKMIHRHLSKISREELLLLAEEFHFAFGQVSHKVADIASLQKGSQFFIKDLSEEKNVIDTFKRMNFSHLKKYSMGATSLSRDDIIREYSRFCSSISS